MEEPDIQYKLHEALHFFIAMAMGLIFATSQIWFKFNWKHFEEGVTMVSFENWSKLFKLVKYILD